MIGLILFFICIKSTYRQQLAVRLLVLEMYCLIVSFLSPNVFVYYAATLAVVPLFAKTRSLISPCYIFAFLTLPEASTNLAVGGIYLIPINAIVALTIGAALTALVRGSSLSPGVTVPGLCLMIIFLVFLWPDARSTTGTDVVRTAIVQSFTFLIPFYVVRRSVRDLEDVRLLLIGLLAAGAALSTLAIYEARTSWPIYRIVSDHFGVALSSGASVKMRGGLLRASGPYIEPLSFAFQLCLASLLAFTGRWMFRSSLIQGVIVGTLLLGLFAPQSRGAWIGLASGIVVYGVISGNSRTLTKITIFIPLAGLLTYVAGLTTPIIGNMLGMNSVGAFNKDYRQILLARGLEEANNHLMWGQNISTLLHNLRDLTQGEGIVDFVNTYLFVLLTSGLVGLIPFILAVVTPIGVTWGLRNSLRQRGLAELAYAGGAFGCILSMLAFISFSGRSVMSLSILLAIMAVFSRLRQPAWQIYRRDDRVIVGGNYPRHKLATSIDRVI